MYHAHTDSGTGHWIEKNLQFYVLYKLKNIGIEKVVINVSFMHQKIM